MDHEPLKVSVTLSPDVARSRIREALNAQGFVTAQLHLTDGCRPSNGEIVVAYCPRLTSRAIALHRHARAAAPTTVLLSPNGRGTLIEVSDPITTVDLAHNPTLLAVLIDVRCRIQRALAVLQSPSANARMDGSSTEQPATRLNSSRAAQN